MIWLSPPFTVIVRSFYSLTSHLYTAVTLVSNGDSKIRLSDIFKNNVTVMKRRVPVEVFFPNTFPVTLYPSFTFVFVLFLKPHQQYSCIKIPFVKGKGKFVSVL
jgi:hypothetical protein